MRKLNLTFWAGLMLAALLAFVAGAWLAPATNQTTNRNAANAGESAQQPVTKF